MLKKTITYDDLDGNQVTEDFYFHLTKADLAKMTMAEEDLESRLRRMIEAKDGTSIIIEFENIIRAAYGRRSEDGKRFIRTPELTEEFLSSEAYSVLFMELFTDAKKGAEFIRGLVPSGMTEKFDEIAANTPELAVVQDNRPAWEKENRNPTQEELQNMSMEEMRRSFAVRFGTS